MISLRCVARSRRAPELQNLQSLVIRKLRTLTSPLSGAAYGPREATTCTLSEGHRLGVNKRHFGACSARTSPIFDPFFSLIRETSRPRLSKTVFWL